MELQNQENTTFSEESDFLEFSGCGCSSAITLKIKL